MINDKKKKYYNGRTENFQKVWRKPYDRDNGVTPSNLYALSPVIDPGYARWQE